MASHTPHSHWNQKKSSVDNPGTADSLADVRSHHAGLAINDLDWDALFDAVRQRLTDSVSELSAGRSIKSGAASSMPRTAFALQNVRVQVLDCVEGLAQLHAALRVTRALASQASQLDSGPFNPEAKQ